MATNMHSRRIFLATAMAGAAVSGYRSRITLLEGDLARLTLKQASDALDTGVVSSVELTEACLERIDRYTLG